MTTKAFSAAVVLLLTFAFLLAFAGASAIDPQKDQADLKKGAAVYKTRCVACHMKDGNAPTKKMRLSDQEWNHGKSIEDVQKVVSEGVKGTVMVGFKNRLSKDEIKDVAAFVLKLSEQPTAASAR